MCILRMKRYTIELPILIFFSSLWSLRLFADAFMGLPLILFTVLILSVPFLTLQVSLDEKNATVICDDRLSAADVAGMIDDMGFGATVLPTEELKGRIEKAVIAIEGMTCQSCVQNIENHVALKSPGVLWIRVLLEEKQAEIWYDARVTAPEQLRSNIEDMGFEALLPSEEDQDAQLICLEEDKANEAACVISIEGMTCQSCVQTIEATIGKKPGVLSIRVSLEKKEAKVGDLFLREGGRGGEGIGA